jgi:DNA modification methylase
LDDSTLSSNRFILDNIRARKSDSGRAIECLSCNSTGIRSLPMHMRKSHPADWDRCCKDFLRLYNQGHSLGQIMKLYGTLFTWKVIDHEIKRVAETGGLAIRLQPAVVKCVEPIGFKKERSSLWRFPKRGDWAVHEGSYRGNWAPQVPRNLILHYTKPGDTVLDPFVGAGTTLVECALLKRRGVGSDISPHAVSLTKQRLKQLRTLSPILNRIFPKVFQCDARSLSMIEDESVDLVCGQPPYANAIAYTAGISRDLSRTRSFEVFCDEMGDIARELHRVLKRGKRCAIMMGDVRRKKMVFPLGFRVMDQFLARDFDLEEIIVKEQFNDRSTRFYTNTLRFRIAHEYIFVFKKSR